MDQRVGQVVMGDPDDEASLDLLEVVEMLRAELGALRLPLATDEVEIGRRERDTLMAQLDDYLLPRLRRMDAPVLAVVGGSTGAGKSTLVNSLVRREVTRSGVLRPTTRSPVLVHHPYDSGAFLSQRILPGLARVTSEAPEPAQPIDVDAPRATALRLVPHEGMPSGIAIVDAPDIDSLVETNRELARQLLAAADLWIFVTTAARYADAVPWDMLRQGVERGVSVAVVLDRVPPASLQSVRTHLAMLLRDRGLATSPLFTIPETPRSREGFLPKEVVTPLLAWLSRLARDARSRDVVIRRTLVGALDSLRDRVPVVAQAADRQVLADEQLRDDLDAAYSAAAEAAEERLVSGGLLQGELLARWQGFLGSGDLFRALDTGEARMLDLLGGAGAKVGAEVTAGEVVAALHTGVSAAALAAVQAATDDALARWRRRPTGLGLLEAAPALTEGGDHELELQQQTARSVRDWQGATLALVHAAEGARSDDRTIGPEPAALLLGLAVLTDEASSGAVSASAISAVAHRVLDSAYGEQEVSALIRTAREDLTARVTALLDGERARVESVLDRAEVRDGRGEMLRSLARAAEEAR